MTGRDTRHKDPRSYPVRDELTPRATPTGPRLRPGSVEQVPPNPLHAVVGGPDLPNPHLPFTIEQADDMEHRYLESGWCICGHHRDDSRNERDLIEPPTVAEIRAILGPTYQPKDTR